MLGDAGRDPGLVWLQLLPVEILETGGEIASGHPVGNLIRISL